MNCCCSVTVCSVCAVSGDDAKLAQDLLLSWKASSGVVPASPSLSRGSSLVLPTTPVAASSAAAAPTSAATATAAAASSMTDSPSVVLAARPGSFAAAIAAAAPPVRASSNDILAESRKRKAEQLAAQAPQGSTPVDTAGGDRKRVSLKPAGGAAARPQYDIDYPAANVIPPAAAAPALPSQDAFFARPAASVPSRAPSAAGAASSAKKPVLPVRPGTTAAADDLRGKVRLQLCRSFDPSAPLSQTQFSDEIVETAAEIESMMFTMYRGTDANYRNKSRETAMNLRDQRNPQLRQRVLAGAISVHDLLTLPFTELASDELKSERDAALKSGAQLLKATPLVAGPSAIPRTMLVLTACFFALSSLCFRWEMQERRSDLTPHVTVTDAFRCGKCRERQCSYYQMQTRSADEPMTTFVRCVKCGNRWRC
jgi:transcription elongation factor S-II